MGFVNERRWGRELGAAVVVAWVLGGCGMLLGLDEYGLQTCDDGMKGTGEVDVDCGGVCGKACAPGMGCGAPGDCESGVCNASGRCEAATCSDGLKNGDESDEDCGGGCGATCGPGGMCEGHGDCVGGVCEGGACAPTCDDKVKSGSETDVDCGGADCGTCELGEGCGEATDCTSGICHAAGCVAEHAWSMSFGDALEQTALSTAIDQAGNVIVAGAMKGTVDFGGGPITSPPNGAYFITKMDATGKYLWTKVFGESIDSSLSVTADSTGKIFVACTSSTKINFGGGLKNNIDPPDVFIAKLNEDGDHVWSNVFGGTAYDRVSSIKVTSKDNIIIAGEFYSSINFGGSPLSNSDNFGDIFLAELTGNGDFVWSKNYQGSASLPPVLMDISSSGEIIVGGGFFGKEVNFGGGPLMGAGGMDIFLAKLDSSGNHIWSNRFGGVGNQSLQDLVIGVAGDVSLVGHFDASFDLGGSTLPYQGGTDAFIASLSSAGNHLWSKPFGDSMNQSARNVATDSWGKVIVGGTMTGMADFGGGLLTAKDEDVFLVALTASGDHVWSRRFGESNAQGPSDIATDGSGNLAVIGQFQGSINFGGTQLTTAGSTDVFVAKLAYP